MANKGCLKVSEVKLAEVKVLPDICPFSEAIRGYPYEITETRRCKFYPKGDKDIYWLSEDSPFRCDIYRLYKGCQVYREHVKRGDRS